MLLGLIALAQLGKIVIFLVTLSVLVVLHEYGHFIVARRNGVRVNEFAVGMGPKFFGWVSPRSGTLYSFRALPIGGYCAMEGEDGKTSEAEQQREFRETGSGGSVNFQSKSPWRRLGIVVAGPIANFILAYVILLFGVFAFGIPSNVPQAVVGPINAGSPANKVGLQTGDRVVAVNGVAIADGSQLVGTIHASLGKHLTLTYVREGVQNIVKVTPAACPSPDKPGTGCIGFYPVVAYERVGFVAAFAASGVEYVNTVTQELENLKLIATKFSTYAGQITGPIGIGQAAITVQDLGWGPYLQLAALISFALGIFNLLPLPALDGGRGAFIVAELIRGKPVDPEKEAFVHIAGLAALLLLMLVVAYHDIARIVAGHGAFN
ncbi:MAG TPA: M50 family metallopeptidase [Verrucomicrobiae bacterium]|nr:M50 family metallopeptidase [Verrucomicrobiae bacterium]